MICCDMLKQNTAFDPKDGSPAEKPIVYCRRFDEYILSLPENCDVGMILYYCPWCGKKLPESKRRKWFDELDSMGIEFSLFDTDQVPPSYLSDAWWKNDK